MTTSQGGTWLELSVSAEPEAVESVAEAFARWGQGVAVEQPVRSSEDGDVVDIPTDAPVLVKTYLPLLDPDWQDRRARIEKAVWALGRIRSVSALQVRELREVDWENAWKEHFYVHRVGQRTVIVPSWREEEYERRAGDVVLLLDPGMAFGTGLHPTTRLCLRALEQLPLEGRRVLDLGAGSGILSIAAARLGARSVDAVEIEPVAAGVCRQNVERNGVSDLVRVTTGSLDALHGREPFDVVLANITIRVLVDLHPQVARVLRPGAPAVLSGVLAERMDELVEALTAAGWTHVSTEHEGDWVALLVHSPA